MTACSSEVSGDRGSQQRGYRCVDMGVTLSFFLISTHLAACFCTQATVEITKHNELDRFEVKSCSASLSCWQLRVCVFGRWSGFRPTVTVRKQSIVLSVLPSSSLDLLYTHTHSHTLGNKGLINNSIVLTESFHSGLKAYCSRTDTHNTDDTCSNRTISHIVSILNTLMATYLISKPLHDKSILYTGSLTGFTFMCVFELLWL